MKRRSLRGKALEGTPHRIIVDDGVYTHGYRVVSFTVFGNPGSTSGQCYGTLALQPRGAAPWDASNNLQIGWSAMEIGDVPGAAAPFSLLDPNHIVVRDLYVYLVGGQTNQEINYLVVIEPVEVTPDQGVLALIKERAQDDL